MLHSGCTVPTEPLATGGGGGVVQAQSANPLLEGQRWTPLQPESGWQQ